MNMKRLVGTRLIGVILLFISHLNAQGQSSTVRFLQERGNQQVQKASPLALSPKSAQSKLTVNGKNLTDQGIFYTVNSATLADLTINPRSQLDLSLPQPDGRQVELQLIRVALTTPDFKVSTDRQERLLLKKGVYYRGIVKGSKNSMVSISLFPNEIVGVINEGKRNRVLGKIKNEELHVLYNEDLVSSQLHFQCAEPTGPTVPFGTLRTAAPQRQTEAVCKVVRMYFEVDYQMYTELGSNASAAANFVLGVFNQVAAIYRNDSIYLQISEIKIWTSPDPYVIFSDFNTTWNAFRDQLNGNFNGDIAHLLSTKTTVDSIKIGRGQFGSVLNDCTIEGVNSTLCDKSQSVCFSFIYANYQNYPTYSWTINVIAHETGHNLGSPHTHNCRWPGGPIDNCGGTEETFNCPGCVPGPKPPLNGGTIMSYCNQDPTVLIDFTNGFGPLPAAKIRTEIQEAACLLISSGAPTFLASDSIKSTTARLEWIPGVCCGDFIVEYRIGITGNFTTVGTTTSLSYALSGLIPGTVYQWRVRSSCSAIYSDIATFTTPVTACLPTYSMTGCANGAGIRSFVLNHQTLSFQSDCGVGSYSMFQSVVPVLKKGDSYNFSVSPLTATATQGAHIWVDSNKNGVFEVGESVASYAPTSGNLVGSLTIPLGASTGTTYLRIRTFAATQTADPCNNYTTAGETEDYLINIVSDTLRVAVSIPATPTLCIGQNINISFGATGSFAGGNTFTAQLSNSAGSFAAPTIIGSVSSTVSGSITAAIPALSSGTAYRIRVISNTPNATYQTDNGHDLMLETCQVTINSAVNNLAVNYHSTPVHASAAMDIQTSNKGFLLPRLTGNQIKAISQPVAGSILFDNTNSCVRVYNGTDWRCLSKNPLFTGAPINTTTLSTVNPPLNARMAAATYCIPTNNPGCTEDDGINSVIINGITLSSSSGCGSANGYTYFPTPVINLIRGETYSFTITTLNYPQVIRMWMDFNRDTTFSNPGERIYSTLSPVSSPFTSTFTIPLTASTGLMRLRIRSLYYQSNLSPCDNDLYGETEDYVVNILNPNIYTFTDLRGTAVLCVGKPFNIPFTTTGTFHNGNVFTAELSDATGSFASPFTLGSVADTLATTISGSVPSNVPIGTGYKIRVTSSNPVTTTSFPTTDTLSISTCIAVITQNSQGVSVNYGGSSLHSSAAMELNVNNKAFLLPRLTNTQITALVGPATGLLVYDLTNNCLSLYDGTQWKCLLTENVPAPIVKTGQTTTSGNSVSQAIANSNGLLLSESGTGVISSAAIAEIRSDRGVLLPRLKTLQRQALPNPTAGMMIYNTDEATLEYYDGNNWRKISK